MALSGTNTKNFSSKQYFRLRLVWSASQSIPNNNSSVTATLYLDSLSGYAPISDGTSSATSITINGNKKSWNTTSSVGANGSKNLGSHTVSIGHNADGTKTFSISASHNVDITYSGSYIGNVTVSGSHTLNTIPRASQFTRLDAFQIGGDPAITISRYASSFTHDITAKIGSTTIQTWTGQGLPTSLAFTDAADNLMYSAIRSSASATMTVTVQTKSGSTNIGGAVSRTCTVTVPSSVVPTFSSITAAETVTSVPGVVGAGNYAQNLSKIKFTINGAAGAKSSTISAYKIVFNGQTWNSSTATTGLINKAGSIVATATITDSRGRSASKSVTVNLLSYGAPTLSKVTAERAIPGGVVNGQGTYIKATTVGSVASLTVGGVQKNKRVLTINTRLKGATEWTQKYTNTSTTDSTFTMANTIGEFLATSAYDVQVVLSDFFNTTISTLTVSTALATMSWGKSGVGIGKIHDENVGGALQVGGDSYFDGKLYLMGGIAPLKVPAGADLNSYTTPGMYYNPNSAESATISNNPSALAFSMFVEQHAGTKQTLTEYQAGYPRTFVRNRYESTWGNWEITFGEDYNHGLAKENGWGNYGGSYATPAYARTNGGLVTLSGMLDGGTRTSGVRIATLPVGYRPRQRHIFTVHAYNRTVTRIDVTPEGYILAMESPSGYVSLSGISFIASR